MICGGFFDLEVKQTEIAEREQLSEQQGFWDDASQAQKIMQEISERKEWISIWESAQLSVQDVEALLQLAEEMGDSSMEQEIDTEISSAKEVVDTLELRKILSKSVCEKQWDFNEKINLNKSIQQKESELCLPISFSFHRRHLVIDKPIIPKICSQEKHNKAV